MSTSRAWGAFWLLALAAGCGELPGESLGTYKVSMKLEENTCGEAAVFSLNQKRYSVELRSEAERAYWRIPGQPPIEGRYKEPEFEFDFRAIVASAGPDAGPTGCRLVQLDRVTGRLITGAASESEKDASADEELDAGAEELDAGTEEHDASEPDDDKDAEEDDADAGTTLEGEHTMTISAEPGTDCSRTALMPQGAFERLPCKLRYQLRGVPTKPF